MTQLAFFLLQHFAAGHSNVSERNADYRTITSGLRFLRNKTIDSHDMIIWAAGAWSHTGFSGILTTYEACPPRLQLPHRRDKRECARLRREGYPRAAAGSRSGVQLVNVDSTRADLMRSTISQLIRAMQRTEVFPDYEEGEISFRFVMPLVLYFCLLHRLLTALYLQANVQVR